ncbi:MAG TPA: hypothetical protein VFM42_06690 [Sphingomicrobium sp.]|jgi:hypothetical protein|nr:hypothetical protein [Sphingomicrobium sp.]
MLRPALALCGLACLAAPVSASTYSAKLTKPRSERFIGRDIVWHCGPAACQGSTDESRPAVLCESLARRAGRIDNFVVDGRAFSPAQLEQCNASAEANDAKAVAEK